MPQHIVLYEFGIIRRASDLPGNAVITQTADTFIPDRTFDLLKQWSFTAHTDTIIQFFIQKGKECLRVKNYVGLLQTSDGTRFEILPKLSKNNSLLTARKSLLKMLRSASDIPFLRLSQARLHEANQPLWEVFISAFIQEMEQIMRQGLERGYQTVEENQSFMRGKWLPHRQNPLHPEWLFTSTDRFTADILPNRLLKACVLFLAKRSLYLPNQIRLRQLRFALEDVRPSPQPEVDFKRLPTSDRRSGRYAQALQWAKVLLNQQSWATAGNDVNDSLLFPTERLFESYIARGAKRYLTSREVSYQDNLHFLIDDHAGKRRFRLRPDLVIRTEDQTIIMDIKWKWINPTAPNYGIEQTDLYQLYAYGRKYHADSLFLIYPAHEDFRAPLPPFRFEEGLVLNIIPFDITSPLSTEIAKMEKYWGEK
ncbi:McrC family protein [Runella slithyformis]|uniref:5-methylcytosine restriction system component-like protein n=1 Tax=Runella slithyformis (strain ATCC 29530 / DSM 19594 / LMG 11500 / NCIMB 11436 / LSU 4) TaxID=761193 RepID=A0A7U4E6A2_RUNSL|nr:McrC family protein [Runella slithyformis]AEI49391.1 5-methylcytosine restriction system component-like protein [Runella slithyformis DSM 19594]